jgi:hypothetical protein
MARGARARLMRLPGDGAWLGYCLNVHPTQTFEEARAALLGPVRAVKRRVCPDAPFGVGLRLSAEAAAEPIHAAAELSAIFAGEGYAAYTMNGFPYGRFHGAPVKAAVYEPDWTTPARRLYTANLARVMAAITPEGETASISTVPGGFGPSTRGCEAIVADGLLRSVADLVAIERETGRGVALALEPEPWCLLESTADAIAFFRDWLFNEAAARRLAGLTGLTPDEATAALPLHLGLCLDVCHMAVNFETPRDALADLARAGIPIHKLQLSAALRIDRMTAAARRRVAMFQDEVYLHQVVVREPDGAMRRILDLPEALAGKEGGEEDEWRVHYHVPIFAELAAPLASTRDVLEEILAIHRHTPISRHLEVETYTWNVAPPDARPGGDLPIADGVARELQWALQQLS